jgi:plasmid stabilization system protein ParE
MKIEFLPAAAAEVEDAVEWYNAQKPGLGERFRGEVSKAVDRILLFPQGWAKTSRRSRRCQLRRFPYGVIYQVREDMILVLALMHLHRKPGYWHGRIP